MTLARASQRLPWLMQLGLRKVNVECINVVVAEFERDEGAVIGREAGERVSFYVGAGKLLPGGDDFHLMVADSHANDRLVHAGEVLSANVLAVAGPVGGA